MGLAQREGFAVLLIKLLHPFDELEGGLFEREEFLGLAQLLAEDGQLLNARLFSMECIQLELQLLSAREILFELLCLRTGGLQRELEPGNSCGLPFKLFEAVCIRAVLFGQQPGYLCEIGAVGRLLL